MAVHLEVLGPSDWRRLREVRLKALADAPDAFWTTLAEARRLDEAAWSERLGPSTGWFVAVADGLDVGLAACAEHRDSDGSAHVISMWVAPRARRVGAGRLLLDACVAWARERALTPVRLEVVDANVAAVALYEGYGFLPSGVVGTFPPPREHLTEHERALHLGSTDNRGRRHVGR